MLSVPMLAKPSSASSLVAAVAWSQGALLGTAATSIAVICVAGVGYQFLAGRIPARRAITVIFGCFILFGAPGIAMALSALAGREPVGDTVEQGPPKLTPVPEAPSRPAPNPFDPYPSQSPVGSGTEARARQDRRVAPFRVVRRQPSREMGLDGTQDALGDALAALFSRSANLAAFWSEANSNGV